MLRRVAIAAFDRVLVDIIQFLTHHHLGSDELRGGSNRLLELLAFFKRSHKTESQYQVWEEGSHPLPA